MGPGGVCWVPGAPVLQLWEADGHENAASTSAVSASVPGSSAGWKPMGTGFIQLSLGDVLMFGVHSAYFSNTEVQTGPLCFFEKCFCLVNSFGWFRALSLFNVSSSPRICSPLMESAWTFTHTIKTCYLRMQNPEMTQFQSAIQWQHCSKWYPGCSLFLSPAE